MIKIDKKRLASILEKTPIKLAYLIGSAAKKTQRQDSDLDIVLVIDKKELSQVKYGRLYQLISQLSGKINLDLRLIVPQKTDPLFLFEIAGGQLLYSRSAKEKTAFVKMAMLTYYDNQHLRNIFNFYLSQRIREGDYGR